MKKVSLHINIQYNLEIHLNEEVQSVTFYFGPIEDGECGQGGVNE